jgi:hypothetical protein
VGAATIVPGVRIADPVAVTLVILAITALSVTALVVPVRALVRNRPMARLREE